MWWKVKAGVRPCLLALALRLHAATDGKAAPQAVRARQLVEAMEKTHAEGNDQKVLCDLISASIRARTP